MAQEQPTRVAQERSPRYPADKLRDAVDGVQKIFAGLGRSAAPAEAMAKALSYTGLSGASRTALAALSYYGLLARDGNNHRVSDLAVRIIRPVSDADKAAAIQQAAFEPPLFAQIKQEHPDVTEEMLATLLLHKGFTEDGSKKAAKVYKDNLEFCAQFGHIPAKDKATETTAPNPVAGETGAKPPMSTHSIAANELPVPIGDNLVARVPFPMTEEDFSLFMATLTLWKKKLVKKPEAEKPKGD